MRGCVKFAKEEREEEKWRARKGRGIIGRDACYAWNRHLLLESARVRGSNIPSIFTSRTCAHHKDVSCAEYRASGDHRIADTRRMLGDWSRFPFLFFFTTFHLRSFAPSAKTGGFILLRHRKHSPRHPCRTSLVAVVFTSSRRVYFTFYVAIVTAAVTRSQIAETTSAGYARETGRPVIQRGCGLRACGRDKVQRWFYHVAAVYGVLTCASCSLRSGIDRWYASDSFIVSVTRNLAVTRCSRFVACEIISIKRF